MIANCRGRSDSGLRRRMSHAGRAALAAGVIALVGPAAALADLNPESRAGRTQAY